MTGTRVVRILSALLVVAGSLVFAAQWTEPETQVIDHYNYQVAIDGMRDGESYYAAYERGFREVYGPIPSPRDVRPPTVYAALSLLPSGWEIYGYVTMAAIAGLVAAGMARVPPTGPLVTAYLLMLAAPTTPDGRVAQYLYAELWVAPLVIGAVYLLARGSVTQAVVLAVAAFAVREQGVVLLLGIALWMWVRRSRRALAFTAVVVSGAAYLAHVLATLPYLDTVDGVHTDLHLGWGPFDSLLRTLGTGFRSGWVGALLLIGAFTWVWRRRLALAAGPYLAIPLLNLWANRVYWGVLVSPLAICLAIDSVWEIGVDRLRGRVTQPPPPA